MIKRHLGFFCFLQTLVFAQNRDDNPSFQFNQDQVIAYNNSSHFQLEGVVGVLEESFFLDARRILDVGCGDGKITALLAKRISKSEIIGCDVSQSMIDFASTHYVSTDYPNLNFVVKNACQLDYLDHFDRVVSFNCLHWISNQQKALEEIYACLRPGGKALLVAVSRSQKDDLQFVCGKVVSSAKWRTHFQDFHNVHSFHTNEEYKGMLTEAHFCVEKIEERVHETVFENREIFEKWISPVLTPMHHLPEMEKAAFLSGIFDELKERNCIDSDGKIHLHFSLIEMLAVKPN